jgi:sugar phosphate permease
LLHRSQFIVDCCSHDNYGYAVDWFSQKRFLSVSMIIWSIFCGLTAVATSFTQLMSFRIVFGLAESPINSLTTKMVRTWFPRDEVGTAMGATLPGGSQIGAAVAGPVIGIAAATFGWRASFVVVMIVGVVWTLIWMLLVTDRPSQSRFVKPEELAEIADEINLPPRPADEDVRPLLYYAKSPAVLATASSLFASNYVLYFLLTWLPSYLVDVRHLDIKTMGILIALPWVVGALGCVGGGLIADWLLRVTRKPILCRTIIVVVGLSGAAAALFLTMVVGSLTGVMILLAFANFTLHFVPGSVWVILGELVPSIRLGTASGYVTCLANLSGIVGPAMTGFIIQYGGGYGSSFVLAGMVAVCSTLAVIIFVRAPVGAHAPAATRP